ncbi:MAG: polyhydroxyalkanoate synthesis regulator DNA-binding domain-containing protein [Candidatus Puniceispirillales bacterium]
MKNNQHPIEKISIKKYSNRRLYNCSTSKYINLKDLIEIITKNHNVKIEDHLTGEDLTQQTLSQLIYEDNNPKKPIFSENFIKTLFKILEKNNIADVSEYLEICLKKFEDYNKQEHTDFEKLNILDLQLQILELKKLIVKS